MNEETVEKPTDSVKMKLEEGVSQVPKKYDGNFEDFSELSFTKSEREQLLELRKLSDDSGFEYGSIVYKGGTVSAYTSGYNNKLEIAEEVLQQKEIHLYHSHTNDTLLSLKDLQLLTHENIDRVSVIAKNGDMFSAYVGEGVKATLEEFNEFTQTREFEQGLLNTIMADPDFAEWTPEQRFYMMVREQAYQVARNFGWTLEGGR